MQIDGAAFAHRSFARVYDVQRKQDVYDFLVKAVEASGGEIIFKSPANKAPVYLGIRLPTDERVGLLVYPFRMKKRLTKNRPQDEVRLQLRYGSESTWLEDHPLAQDIAGVDTTLILGAHLEAGLFMALDPQLYDLLPMGISFYMKDHQVAAAQRDGWHVWESETHDGRKRSARSPALETFIAFTPENLLRLARLESRARHLKLEPALRYAAAISPATDEASAITPGMHVLEKEFALTSREIIDIIAQRNRLSVAVRGGVAEYHLEDYLRRHAAIAGVEPLDIDAKHDFNVTLRDGRVLRIECKNASPTIYANGDFRVETQKTRESSEPGSRFYRHDSFDIVAACMYSPTGSWSFRFAETIQMRRHSTFPDRLAAIQRIDSSWASALEDLQSVTEHGG